LRQPLYRCRARVRRRGDRAVGDSGRGDQGAAHPGHQAGHPSTAQAREHPAVSTEQPPEPGAGRPALRVLSGDATPEELATIVAVLAAAGGTAEPPPARRSLWADSARVPGSRLAPGPGAWRASALPR